MSRGSERNRTRLALALATLGIAAALLAYAVSPGVRHAVSHAAHSVKHAVSNVFDRDKNQHVKPPAKHAKGVTGATAPGGSVTSTKTPARSHTSSTSAGAQHANSSSSSP